MPKAKETDKQFYWKLRDEIHEWYSNDGTLLDKVGLHEVLKLNAGLHGVSMSNDSTNAITHEELQELKEKTKAYALEHCGIEYDKDKRIKLNFKR